jgi:hypothetical protein
MNIIHAFRETFQPPVRMEEHLHHASSEKALARSEKRVSFPKKGVVAD